MSAFENIILRGFMTFGIPGLLMLGFLTYVKLKNAYKWVSLFSITLALISGVSAVLLNGSPDLSDTLKTLSLVFWGSAILNLIPQAQLRLIGHFILLLFGLYPVLLPIWSDSISKFSINIIVASAVFILFLWLYKKMPMWIISSVQAVLVILLGGYMTLNGSLAIGQSFMLCLFVLGFQVLVSFWQKDSQLALVNNMAVTTSIPIILCLEFFNFAI